MYHRATHERVHGPSEIIRSSSTVRVSRNTNGVYLHVKPQQQKAAPDSGGQKMFKITAISPDPILGIFYDYVMAKEWDGLNLTGDEIPIAKHWLWRPSITSRMVGLITYNFVYASDNERTSTVSFDTPQTEQLIEPYQVDNSGSILSDPGQTFGIIWAVKTLTGVSAPGFDDVGWLDTTPRQWGRV